MPGTMRRVLGLLIALAACDEVAYDTTIAREPARRAAMAKSITPGLTEGQVIARWGAPTQKRRTGGQTDFIYRSMKNPRGYWAPAFGDSANYVVVSFQYGEVIGVVTSETGGCRATFPPRPPGPGFPNPATVHPAATSPDTVLRPGVPPDLYAGGKAD